MDLNTGQLSPLERTLQRWPFWKKFLLVIFAVALLGMTLALDDFIVWLVDKIINHWRIK